MEASYYIQAKKINRKGKTSIMLDVAWQGRRLQVSSGVMVSPENFVNSAKRVIHSREDNALALDWKLGQLRLSVQAGYLALERNAGKVTEITRELVKAMVGEQLVSILKLPKKPRGAPVAPKKKTGHDIWEVHARWQHLNRLKHTPGHLRSYLPTRKWLAVYAPTLALEELTEEWVQEYINWLVENSPLRDGGMRNHIKFFRAMLKFQRLPYEWMDNPFTEYTSGVDLTYEEVMQLYYKEYASVAQREAADVYVFLTQVGLRHGDFLKLTKLKPVLTKTRGEVFVIFDQRQGKTKDDVTIALTPLALSIWNKYHGELPKWTNQNFNRYIKLAAAAAELTRIVDVKTIRYGNVTITPRPVHEIISAHTARHTAATLILEGSDDLRIAQLTLGHRDHKSTNIYARANDLKQMDQHLGAWEKLQQQATPPPDKSAPALP